MAAACGRTASSAKAQRFTSPYPRRHLVAQFEEVGILLVEDNTFDAERTIRSLKDQELAKSGIWVKDGEQALDCVLRRGAYAQRTSSDPRLILLALKMPRVG